MNRRQLIYLQAAAAGCLIQLPACGGSGKMDNGDPGCLEDGFAVPDADRLEPGQLLFVVERETILVRDEQGFLALQARCTHAGCSLLPKHFNSTALTLDCECHGSRFALDGRVVQGPAQAPLPRRALCRTGGILTVSTTRLANGATGRVK
jgi:Rieske Fe-S protein